MRLTAWVKPEYVLRPGQLLRRVASLLAAPRQGYLTRRLPWGLEIRVRPNELQGKAILHLGIIDLAVTEALWRRCEPGETCLEIGANIGYMTSVMAARVGPHGRVVLFEAHPDIYRELEAHCSAWRQAIPSITLDAHYTAVSECRGTLKLEVQAEFARNRGVCRVVDRSVPCAADLTSLTVDCDRLDNLLGAEGRVRVAKMDVEGHEASVLQGARCLLARGAVRDWVFEHHPEYPSAVTNLLEEHGYQVLRLQKGFSRPRLLAPEARAARSTWEPTSFLATGDPGRVTARFRAAGWQCLQGGVPARANRPVPRAAPGPLAAGEPQ